MEDGGGVEGGHEGRGGPGGDSQEKVRKERGKRRRGKLKNTIWKRGLGGGFSLILFLFLVCINIGGR